MPSCNKIIRLESAMQITVELPEDIARHLAADARSLSRVAIEALAIEGVRSGKLSTGQARRLLGFNTRMQVDGFLKEHGVLLAPDNRGCGGRGKAESVRRGQPARASFACRDATTN